MGDAERLSRTELRRRSQRLEEPPASMTWANNSYVLGFGITLVILMLAALVGIWLTFGYGVRRGNDIEDEVDDIWDFIKKDLKPSLAAIMTQLMALQNSVNNLTVTVDDIQTEVNTLGDEVTSLGEAVDILQENITSLSEDVDGVIPPLRTLCGQDADLNFGDFDPDTPVNVGIDLVYASRFPTSALPGAQIAYNAEEGEFEVNNIPTDMAVPLQIQAHVFIKDAGGSDGTNDNTFRFMVTTNGTNCMATDCPSSFFEDRQRYQQANQQYGTNTMQLNIDVTVNVRNGDKFYFFVSSKGAFGTIEGTEDENTSVCAASFFSFQPQTRMFTQILA